MKKTTQPKPKMVQRGADKPAREKTYVFQLEVKAPPYQLADDQRSKASWAVDDIAQVFQDAICSYLERKTRWVVDPKATDEEKKQQAEARTRQLAYNDAKIKIAETIFSTLKYVKSK